MTRIRLFAVVLPTMVACQGGDTGGNDDGGDPPDGPLTYEPIVTYDRFEFQGRPVMYYVPDDVKAIVWLFHGTNGHVDYVTKLETIATTNVLIPEGIGFVGSQSLEQGPDNQWDTSTPMAGNPDVQFLLDLHDQLIELTSLSATTPQLTLGFSNGGDMAGFYAESLLALGQDVRAVAPHSSGGHAFSGLDLPYSFILPVNDTTGRAGAEGVEDERDAQGLRTDYHEPPEVVPLTPHWWSDRNPNLPPDLSEQTFDEMVRLGLIDADGYRLIDVEDTEDALLQWEKDTTVPSASLRTEETRVAWALHRMNGYYAHEVRDFFLDAL